MATGGVGLTTAVTASNPWRCQEPTADTEARRSSTPGGDNVKPLQGKPYQLKVESWDPWKWGANTWVTGDISPCFTCT